MIIFYTTDCPKCKILKTKMDAISLEYNVCNDVNKMLQLGMQSAPALQIDDGTILDFGQSIKWLKENF